MAAVHISARASSLSTRHFAARPASKFLRVILGVKPDLEQVLASLPPPHLYVLEATVSKISAFHRGLPSTPRRSAPSAVPGPNLVETDAPFVPDHEVWRTLGPDRVRWWSSLPYPLFCKDLELLLASPPGGGRSRLSRRGPLPLAHPTVPTPCRTRHACWTTWSARPSPRFPPTSGRAGRTASSTRTQTPPRPPPLTGTTATTPTSGAELL